MNNTLPDVAQAIKPNFQTIERARAYEHYCDHIDMHTLVKLGIFDKMDSTIQLIAEDAHEETFYLYFKDHIGTFRLTGNALLPYPRLAKALRTIPCYPILRVVYELSELTALKGLHLLKAYPTIIASHLETFKAEKEKQDRKVDQLVKQYTDQPQLPIITDIKRYIVNNTKNTITLVIGDLEYAVQTHLNNSVCQLKDHTHLCKSHCIFNLHWLLKNRPYMEMAICSAIARTPLLRVICKRTDSHKGTPKYIDINRGELLSITQAKQIARKDYGITTLDNIKITEIKE